jgi:hypothetical protein
MLQLCQDIEKLDATLHSMNVTLARMRKRRSSALAFLQTLVPPRTVSCPYF